MKKKKTNPNIDWMGKTNFSPNTHLCFSQILVVVASNDQVTQIKAYKKIQMNLEHVQTFSCPRGLRHGYSPNELRP